MALTEDEIHRIWTEASDNMKRQCYDTGRYEIGRHLTAAIVAIEGEERGRELMRKVVEWSKDHPEPDMDVALGIKRTAGVGAVQ